jgi:glycosyltransferase involved in cell wall biosynthesis
MHIGNKKNILVMSSGNARSSKLWSGTPFNIIKELEKNDWSVSTLNANDFRPELVYREGAAGKTKYQNVVHGLKNHWNTYKLGKIITDHFNSLSKDYFNILHIYSYSYLPLGQIGKYCRQYLVIDCTRNTWIRYSGFHTSVFAKWGGDLLAKRIYQTMDHIFAVGEYVREDLISHYKIDPEKITTIGSGPGNVKPYYGQKNYCNGLILSAAKDRANDKGTHLLIEAFKLAQDINPNIRLKIVGGSSSQETATGLKNVELTGFLPTEELQKCFEEASLFAMPALHEPWGLVYVESLGCKTPILGLARNALPEITLNGKFGFLAAEPDAQLIADAILTAFSDLDKLARMGAEGQRACLERYSWESVAKKIENVILNL